MPVGSWDNYIVQGQRNQTGSDDELAKVEYLAGLEATSERSTKFKDFFNFEQYPYGRQYIEKRGRGRAKRTVLKRGVSPERHGLNFNNRRLYLDGFPFSGQKLAHIDEFFTDDLSRQDMAHTQGVELDEMEVEANFISLGKAGMATEPTYVGTDPRFKPAIQIKVPIEHTLDGNKLYNTITQLMVQLAEINEFDPESHDSYVIMPKQQRIILAESDYLSSRDRVTTYDENVFSNARQMKSHNLTVLDDIGMPFGKKEEDHLLTTEHNNYNFDFSDLIAVLFTPESIWGGYSFDNQVEIWWDSDKKDWVVDTWRSYVSAPNMVQHTAAIMIQR